MAPRIPSAAEKAAFRAWCDRWQAVHEIEVREWRETTIAQRFEELEALTHAAHVMAQLHPHAPIDTEEAAVWARWQHIRRRHGARRPVARRARPRTRRAARLV